MVCFTTEIDISTWYVAILSQYKLEVVTIKIEMKGNESLIYGLYMSTYQLNYGCTIGGFFFPIKHWYIQL